MKILTTKDFHRIAVDVYVDEYNLSDFWITREQVGQLLNYRKPEWAIKGIHKRFEWEFNHFYKNVEINVRRKGKCKTVVYNFDGLIKICSFSRKSRAKEAVNFFWEIKSELEHMQNLPATTTGTANGIQLFNYGENPIRIIKKDNEFWFVAKDLGEILGLTNIRVEFSRLDEDERGEYQIVTPSNGGYSNVNIVSESGLYKLTFRSNKPEAKKFTRWVTSEVLPTLIRTGTYNIRKATPMLPEKDFYSAIEIGRELNMSDIQVVNLASKHDLLIYGFTQDWDWYFTNEGREKIINAARI